MGLLVRSLWKFTEPLHDCRGSVGLRLPKGICNSGDFDGFGGRRRCSDAWQARVSLCAEFVLMPVGVRLAGCADFIEARHFFERELELGGAQVVAELGLVACA